jgi:hypothetical protein
LLLMRIRCTRIARLPTRFWRFALQTGKFPLNGVTSANSRAISNRNPIA